MANQVMVGCRLPNGLILEVGYEIYDVDEEGKRFVNYRQTDRYKRVRLNGWNDASGAKQAIRYAREQKLDVALLPPAPLNPGVGLTTVDEEFWLEWKEKHKDMFKRLSSGDKPMLFEAKNQNESNAMTKALMSAPAVLAPIDGKKPAPTFEPYREE